MTLDADGNLYGTTTGGGASGDGTVFEIVKDSMTVTTLASFNGTNGKNPDAGVTLDAGGNLYGTTYTGGTSNFGVVFEIVKGSANLTPIASFNARNGENPEAGVTLDAAGNLYGTTRLGGDIGYGTVFEIAKGTNSVTTLASFNQANGSYPYGGIMLDAAGNLYGTTEGGWPGGWGTVFKLSPALPGDANLDGKVDFADLVVLARHYGMSSATWTDGDFNADGSVGFDDLVMLARNYGQSNQAALLPDVSDPLSLKPKHRRAVIAMP